MIKIYENEKFGWVCELWGGSTKHADSVFKFSDFKTTDYVPPIMQIYQWLLECASKLTWPMFAHELAKKAENYYLWDKSYFMVHGYEEVEDLHNGLSVFEDVELILATDEQEAIELMKTGHYMKDQFTLAQSEERTVYDYFKADIIEFGSPDIDNWFHHEGENLPF